MPSRRPAELLLVPLLVLAALSGCAEPRRPPVHPPEISHPLFAPPAEVVEAAFPVLEARGIEVISADPATGIVRGRAAGLGDNGWAQCPVARIRDTDDKRIRIAEPREMDLELELQASPAADGSSLIIRPVFERTYLDSFRFSEFQRRCPSTGVLEREIVDALATA